mgnify:CR=1 FL=1
MKDSYVYIVTNRKDGVLYTGVTSDLKLRTEQHKLKVYDGFSSKYNTDKLVYFEGFSEIELAIEREKQIKKYTRKKKIALIESMNREWRDFSPEIGVEI